MFEQVAVVIPRYRPILTEDDAVSIRHLHTYLNGIPMFWVTPASLDFQAQGHHVLRFPDQCFRDINAYSRLLLSLEFYQAFEVYSYILIYQLDCLVFSPQLLEWVRKGCDYTGAPLFVSKTDPAIGKLRVGNGGFSLRRVQAFIDTLTSTRKPSLAACLQLPLLDMQLAPSIERTKKRLQIYRQMRAGVKAYTSFYSLNEDLFWSDRAALFNPRFRTALVNEALKFAFEIHPRYCYRLNHEQLPFGCHAWARWDRWFWEPFLLPC